jgi:hypothetical protein
MEFGEHVELLEQYKRENAQLRERNVDVSTETHMLVDRGDGTELSFFSGEIFASSRGPWLERSPCALLPQSKGAAGSWQHPKTNPRTINNNKHQATTRGGAAPDTNTLSFTRTPRNDNQETSDLHFRGHSLLNKYRS